MNKKNNLAPFVATPPIVARYMLRVAEPRQGNVFLDIGCGTGSIIQEAADPSFGFSKIYGIECDLSRARECEKMAKELELDNVEIIHDDFFNVDLSVINPDIVSTYITTSGLTMLKKSLEKLKNGARVVSSVYNIEGWQPYRSLGIDFDNNRRREVFVYKMGEHKYRPNSLPTKKFQ